MSDKSHHAPSHREAKSSRHGAFKHVAEPATLAEVLAAYGLRGSVLRQVRADVKQRLAKEPAHAR